VTLRNRMSWRSLIGIRVTPASGTADSAACVATISAAKARTDRNSWREVIRTSKK
jgi:hypothetical protein